MKKEAFNPYFIKQQLEICYSVVFSPEPLNVPVVLTLSGIKKTHESKKKCILITNTVE